MRNALLAPTVILALCTQFGCEAPPPARPSMSTIWLQDVGPHEAFDVTKAVLHEFDFRVELADSDAGYLKTVPAESTVRGGTGRLSDPILQSPNRIRRIAEAYVQGRAGGTEIRLAVNWERRDTAAYRAYAREHQDQDAPTETPIERERGTTPEQYESWTSIGRDRETEADIRRALEERLRPSD